MTETAPLGTTAHLKPALAGLPADERYAYRCKQGLPPWGGGGGGLAAIGITLVRRQSAAQLQWSPSGVVSVMPVGT